MKFAWLQCNFLSFHLKTDNREQSERKIEGITKQLSSNLTKIVVFYILLHYYCYSYYCCFYHSIRWQNIMKKMKTQRRNYYQVIVILFVITWDRKLNFSLSYVLNQNFLPTYQLFWIVWKNIFDICNTSLC